MYYARAGVVEDATRQQGGWRTTSVMKAIYTTLNRSEVQEELLRVVNATSLAVTVRNDFKLLGKSAEEVLKQPPHVVQPFLTLVSANVKNLTEEFLTQSNVVAALHVLLRHSDSSVQSQSSHLYAMARSMWMAAQSNKRAKQE